MIAISITRFRLSFLIILLAWGITRAEFPDDRPFPGITYKQETRTDPPMRLLVATVDLTNSKTHIRVAPGGSDPDGSGPWETTLMRPTAIAAREGFDLVINGDFFDARNVKDAEGAQSQYRPDLWASAIGAAVTDGRVWSTAKEKRPCLVVHRDAKTQARFRYEIEPIDKPPTDSWEIVAGGPMLVMDGKPLPQKNKARHPRTVVGLDKNGTKLTILVVDGRRPGMSIGMTFNELAQEMNRLGCRQALNLDGGGSTVMAMRDPATGNYKILNTPSDGRERAVANVLGVTVDKPRANKPATRSDGAR